ncbi:SRPBCC family protein [Halobacillus yeomjeoni]|uniref:SRPBCC family protein n=1 Tax=Halobacillus yeomjeoni TaxID=311194 RepID=A0A931MV73_9BACI|nr:SRPBCC family protein [Halobacillus yeomjeoni]MBH0230728.1 SRPBCC family protein [Halobacillus yeomjeoni]
MPIIQHQLYIDAPKKVCFDLARDVEIHTQTVSKTNERAVRGVTSGLLEVGDEVTWEATHFGAKQKLTAKVISMDKYNQFVDVMVKGAFHSFTHTHLFKDEADGTIMIDIFEYKSPFKFLGVIVDKLFLERYMRKFIVSRAKMLKKIAEAGL